jgi:hypothetical protein
MEGRPVNLKLVPKETVLFVPFVILKISYCYLQNLSVRLLYYYLSMV